MKHGIHALATGYFTVLCLFTVFVLLLTFVIPRRYQVEAAETATTQQTAVATAATTVKKTADSYVDGTLSVSLNTYRVADTTVYVADITAPPSSLKAALADNTYGRNITETTSAIAAANNAVIAVNGDYYGARDSGYVIRNGDLYRATSAGSDREDAVIILRRRRGAVPFGGCRTSHRYPAEKGLSGQLCLYGYDHHQRADNDQQKTEGCFFGQALFEHKRRKGDGD